jgi:hypothetical protein
MYKITLKYFLKRSFLLSVVIVACSFAANAQTAKAAADAKAPAVGKGAASYIETFFKKYKTSADSAIDYIFGTNKFFATNTQIALLKNKLDSLQFSIGKYEGRELIAQKSSSPSLVLYSFLVKHQNQPIRFTFIMYRAQNEWALYRFNYDDQMDIELFEAAKINNKRP